jgi:hypothetical protein
MVDLKTSWQSFRMAALRSIPVMRSAAFLKEVTRHYESMVKTPSESSPG